jgi:hypothetical protein
VYYIISYVVYSYVNLRCQNKRMAEWMEMDLKGKISLAVYFNSIIFSGFSNRCFKLFSNFNFKFIFNFLILHRKINNRHASTILTYLPIIAIIYDKIIFDKYSLFFNT